MSRKESQVAVVTGAERQVMPVAVFGTGTIGVRHLETFRKIEGVSPIAVPVRFQRRQELEGLGYRACSRLEEARGLGASCAVIATDTARHASDVVDAMRLGLDVLVEKPMALNAQEAHRVEEEAVRLGRKIFVGCVLRFSESLNQFHRWLPEIGKVHSVEIECRSYLPDWRNSRPYRDSYSARAGEGGVLLDLIHEVDYAGWIFGWPAALWGRLLNLGRLGIGAEEVAELGWESPEGFPVSIGLDYLTRPPRRSIRVFGDRGTLQWDGRVGEVHLFVEGTAVQATRSAQTRDEMFVEQAQAWCAAIDGKRDLRLASVEEGVKALAVCDAARLSSQTRQEERVLY